MDYYNKIKNELINNEVYKKVKDYSKNRNDLMTYYNVGKLLIKAQGGETRAKYGNNIIKEYSRKLSNELGKGYTFTALVRMRQFYLQYKNVATMSQLLTWSHYIELLKFNDNSKINYYVNIIETQNLSVRQLREKIKNKEYERLDNKTREKLISKVNIKIEDYIKNPILIKNIYNYSKISEKILKQLILEDLDNFLKELGSDFCYVGNEYKIKLGNRYNYIDILLYNIKYNCYTVIELKVTELRKEHIGQIKMYMNYIDKSLKSVSQDKTIGIIICRKDNQFVMEYCSDQRIFRTIYNLN
ncbi:MAG: DUF1016 domain-containing protein [Firmicutes bacterium]|nr:DUF1016 domain-containing protein [Bacillota bacterium]